MEVRGEDAREHARHVGVHEGGAPFEGEGRDGPGGVGADPRKGAKLVRLGREST